MNIKKQMNKDEEISVLTLDDIKGKRESDRSELIGMRENKFIYMCELRNHGNVIVSLATNSINACIVLR